MALTTRTILNDANYQTQRYNLIKLLEESGNVSLKAYIDTEQARIPTIGLGFNIAANLDAILQGMGIRQPKSDLNLPYYNRLLAIASRNTYHDTAADELQLQADLNQVMADRAVDPNITEAKRTTFEFNTEVEVQSVFNAIAQIYNDKIVTWEKHYGISPATATAPSLPQSPELLVLFSLSYNTVNGGSSLLGKGLAGAIKSGNRAEAWFEVRYNSNKGQDLGVAKRRYIESEVFGLYATANTATEAEAKSVYAMLAKHRNLVLAQEAKWGMAADGTRSNILSNNKTALELAQFDGTLVATSLDNGQVNNLVENLTPARDAFIAWVNSQLPSGETPLTASTWNPAAIYYRAPDSMGGNVLNANSDNDKGNGLDKNLLVGDDRSDYLLGGSGDDILIGNGGDDILEGGPGADILYGGAGQDTYIINVTNGVSNDRIIDSDNNGRIVIEGTNYTLSLGVLQKEAGVTGEIWKDPSGKVTLTHNSPWRLTLDDGSVIELGEDFDAAGFGMTLLDAPEEAPPGNYTQTLVGSSGIDWLTTDPSDAGDQLVQGLDGNDILNTSFYASTAGHHRLEGGAGDDYLTVAVTFTGTPEMQAILDGGVGNDWLQAGESGDVALGGEGNDRIQGGSGDDQIEGGNDADWITTGAGEDTVLGGNGDDILDGVHDFQITSDLTLHRDRLVGAYFQGNPQERGTVLTNEQGNIDYVYRLYQSPRSGTNFFGEDGQLATFTYTPNSAATYFHGSSIGSFDADASMVLGTVTIEGLAYDITLEDAGVHLETDRKSLSGGAGNDALFGGMGDDEISGGTGNDTLLGNQGVDQMDGGSGEDVLAGGEGDDHLSGGIEDDQLFGEHGADTLMGGSGHDQLYGDQYLVEGETNTGTGDGDDLMLAGDGDDLAVGGGGTDTLIGDAGNDQLFGDDTLNGLAGNDSYLWNASNGAAWRSAA